MKTLLIFILGLALGLLVYFGYAQTRQPIVTTEQNTFAPLNQTENSTAPVVEEVKNGDLKVEVPTVETTKINEDRVYKITFNATPKVVRDARFDDFEGDASSFLITLFNIHALEKEEYQKIQKLFEVKEVYSGKDNSIVTYYMWLDKSIPKIDTTQKYTYKNIVATIQPASLDLTPYILSDTYCKEDSDCTTGAGAFCSVYATNSFQPVYGIFGCVVANYPEEDPDFVEQEDIKCRDKSITKQRAGYLDISYAGATCVKNKCTSYGKKVSCFPD